MVLRNRGLSDSVIPSHLKSTITPESPILLGARQGTFTLESTGPGLRQHLTEYCEGTNHKLGSFFFFLGISGLTLIKTFVQGFAHISSAAQSPVSLFGT